MGNNLPFSRPPITLLSELSVANTAYDGTGTIVDATATAPATDSDGWEIDELTLALEEAIADSSWKIFHHDGTKFHMIAEVDIEPVTPAAGTVNAQLKLNRNDPTHGGIFPIHVPAGHRLGTALHTADAATVKSTGRRL